MGGESSTALLALLRAHLGTGELPAAGELAAWDWAWIEMLARHHGVSSMLFRAIAPRVDAVPRDVVRRLWMNVRATAQRTAAVSALAADVAPRLHAAGLSGILLKGAALGRTLYDDPGLRPSSDLDLLVREHDVPRVAALLEVGGFGRIGRPVRPEWPTCEFHAVYVRPDADALPVELHWGLFESYLPYAFDLDAVWRRAQPIADLPGAYTMSPEHELAHLGLHLERHALVYRSIVGRRDWCDVLVRPHGLARLVWLMDIARHLQRYRDRFDWDAFVADARRWAIGDRLRVVFTLCERALGVGPPAGILQAFDRPRPGLVERGAHRVVLALGDVQARSGKPSVRAGCEVAIDRATGWSHMWTSLAPPGRSLSARHPGGSRFGRRARHLATMTPPVLRAIGRRLGVTSRPTPAPLGGGTAVVVVPIYKPEPDIFDAASWHRCLSVFADTPIAVIAPEGLDLAAWIRPPDHTGRRPIHVVRFAAEFFESQRRYNALMLAPSFYRRFATYEFLLLHQLDVFVFRNDLADWCAREWDYVGAPWFDLAFDRAALPPTTRDNLVGNGGFSLRRVASCVQVLETALARQMAWDGNEDVFWSFWAPVLSRFRIPTWQEAVAFSMELNPERGLAENGAKLPFGCHGWTKGPCYDFWRPYVRELGYEV